MGTRNSGEICLGHTELLAHILRQDRQLKARFLVGILPSSIM